MIVKEIVGDTFKDVLLGMFNYFKEPHERGQEVISHFNGIDFIAFASQLSPDNPFGDYAVLSFRKKEATDDMPRVCQTFQFNIDGLQEKEYVDHLISEMTDKYKELHDMSDTSFKEFLDVFTNNDEDHREIFDKINSNKDFLEDLIIEKIKQTEQFGSGLMDKIVQANKKTLH